MRHRQLVGVLKVELTGLPDKTHTCLGAQYGSSSDLGIKLGEGQHRKIYGLLALTSMAQLVGSCSTKRLIPGHGAYDLGATD